MQSESGEAKEKERDRRTGKHTFAKLISCERFLVVKRRAQNLLLEISSLP